MASVQKKRFTVSLEANQYDALNRIAQTHKPPLTLQYVTRLAVQRLIDEYDQGQLNLVLEEKKSKST
jgi:hypothetical protein